MPEKKLLDDAEKEFQKDFLSEYGDVLEYANNVGHLIFLLSDKFAELGNLNKKQLSAYLLSTKAQRCLRRVIHECSMGYWPEATSIIRTIFEISERFQYILMDKTDGRARKWLNGESQHWRMSDIMDKKGEITKQLEIFYHFVSLHSHVSSAEACLRLMEETSDGALGISNGPLFSKPDRDFAETLIGETARVCFSIALLIMSLLPEDKALLEFKSSIEKTPYAQKKAKELEKIFQKNPQLEIDAAQHVAKLNEK